MAVAARTEQHLEWQAIMIVLLCTALAYVPVALLLPVLVGGDWVDVVAIFIFLFILRIPSIALKMLTLDGV